MMSVIYEELQTHEPVDGLHSAYIVYEGFKANSPINSVDNYCVSNTADFMQYVFVVRFEEQDQADAFYQADFAGKMRAVRNPFYAN